MGSSALSEDTVDIWHLRPLLAERVSKEHAVRSNRLEALRILGSYLLPHEKPMTLKVNAHGKPFLEKSRLFFNMSHSEKDLLLAVTRGSEIGIDLEWPRAIPNVEDLVRHSLNFEERECFDLNPTPSTFFTAWVRKEAWVKGIGTGFTHNPEQSKGNLLAWPKGFSGRIRDDSGRSWTIFDLNFLDQGTGALAVASERSPTLNYYPKEIQC